MHTDSQYALNYYGKPQYADEWVQAAFAGTSTNYTNGGADFSAMGFIGKEEAIKTGIVVLHTFMYAINECANHTQKYCGGKYGTNATGQGVPGQAGFNNYQYWKTLHAWVRNSCTTPLVLTLCKLIFIRTTHFFSLGRMSRLLHWIHGRSRTWHRQHDV